MCGGGLRPYLGNGSEADMGCQDKTLRCSQISFARARLGGSAVRSNALGDEREVSRGHSSWDKTSRGVAMTRSNNESERSGDGQPEAARRASTASQTRGSLPSEGPNRYDGPTWPPSRCPNADRCTGTREWELGRIETKWRWIAGGYPKGERSESKRESVRSALFRKERRARLSSSLWR